MPNNQQLSLPQGLLITGVSLLLGIGFNYLLYGQLPGIGFFLYTFLVIGGLFVVSRYLGKPIDRQILWLMLPLVFFSSMVFVHASYFLTFLNVVATLVLLLTIAEATWGAKLSKFHLAQYGKILFLPFAFIGPFFQTLSTIVSTRHVEEHRPAISQITRGIMLTIPIVGIFVLLFSSADLVFQKYLSNLFHFHVEPETIFRLILILGATSVLTGAYTYIFTHPSPANHEEANPVQTIGHIELAIILGSINILFLLFILIQITYLFGGAETIVAEGFTYADYARRGFFELIAVAMIAFSLLWAMEKYRIKQTHQQTTQFQVMSSLLLIQVLLIMLSAWKRLSLYEAAYGLTILRLYSHAILIFLVVVALLLLVKIFRGEQESTFAFRLAIALGVFLLAMNLLNPDAYVARQNIARFVTTGKVDTDYLSLLSDDAIPATLTALSIPSEEIKGSVARDLYARSQATSRSDWRSFHLARQRGTKLLEPKRAELEPYKDYQPPVTEPTNK